jgi:cell shape-determining protein MreC
MLTRVCLIAAVVFGVLVATLNLWKVREVIVTTRNELNTTSNNLYTTRGQLSDTRQELSDTQDDLEQTKQNLETTTADRDRLRNANDSLSKQNNQLQQTLKTTTETLQDTQARLAQWNALGVPVDEVGNMIATYRATEEALEVSRMENQILAKALTRATNELARFLDPDHQVPLPAGLQGTVLVADPKWEFVVLDIGEDQQVLKDAEMLVSRNGRLVAKVRIQSVQKDRSIANLMNGWTLSDVLEGDMVIPAHVSTTQSQVSAVPSL